MLGLDGEVDLVVRIQHRLLQVFVVGRQSGVELVFGRDLQMAFKVVALDGGILHQVVLHLVVEFGVGILRLFAHIRASLHDGPQHHQTDGDKHPEHNRLNA